MSPKANYETFVAHLLLAFSLVELLTDAFVLPELVDYYEHLASLSTVRVTEFRQLGTNNSALPIPNFSVAHITVFDLPRVVISLTTLSTRTRLSTPATPNSCQASPISVVLSLPRQIKPAGPDILPNQ
jgi:hypothetical protein